MSCDEEESVQFSCEVNKSEVELTWLKDGTRIIAEEGTRIESEGRVRKLIIARAELSNAGMYTAQIEQGVESSATLLVMCMCLMLVSRTLYVHRS